MWFIEKAKLLVSEFYNSEIKSGKDWARNSVSSWLGCCERWNEPFLVQSASSWWNWNDSFHFNRESWPKPRTCDTGYNSTPDKIPIWNVKSSLSTGKGSDSWELKFESILWQLKILETIGRTAVPLWVSADCFSDSLISEQTWSCGSIWASGRDRPSDWWTGKTNHWLTSASSLIIWNPVLSIWQWAMIVLNRTWSIDDFENSRWARIDISRGRAHPKWNFWHWILRIHMCWYRHDQRSRL